MKTDFQFIIKFKANDTMTKGFKTCDRLGDIENNRIFMDENYYIKNPKIENSEIHAWFVGNQHKTPLFGITEKTSLIYNNQIELSGYIMFYNKINNQPIDTQAAMIEFCEKQIQFLGSKKYKIFFAIAYECEELKIVYKNLGFFE